MLSDFAIEIDDLDFLQAVVTDVRNEPKLSPDHRRFVARIVDLRSQGHSREEILEILRVEFEKPRGHGQRHSNP